MRTRQTKRNRLRKSKYNFVSHNLNNFNDATENWLFFEVGEIGDDWGQTSGYVGNSANSILPDAYTIVIDNDLNQNGSNLAIMATLAHELIHAYMFDTLSDAGVITFDQNTGVPKLNVICQDGTNYNNLNLNTLSTSERFAALICAMEASNTLTPQWSHDLFNENVFSVTTYQQQLADFIFENHDWNSEDFDFKNDMISYFGSNWKLKTAEACSWIGLTDTTEYSSYRDSITNPMIKTGLIQLAEYRNFVNDANFNCN
ncbi:hypothetical protein RBU60_11090 [Mesonia sp. MT50]|uniref:SprT-like domain-containing protein n=1 Tax=Mesonia profundi TaxID=3070998 RepID=A0ABU1A330_9FLAO|nr:hypothetical protein [Mesonia profundi]MDQ7918123.1 hypothetical protein [Mesonia profundi]